MVEQTSSTPSLRRSNDSSKSSTQEFCRKQILIDGWPVRNTLSYPVSSCWLDDTTSPSRFRHLRIAMCWRGRRHTRLWCKRANVFVRMSGTSVASKASYMGTHALLVWCPGNVLWMPETLHGSSSSATFDSVKDMRRCLL